MSEHVRCRLSVAVCLLVAAAMLMPGGCSPSSTTNGNGAANRESPPSTAAVEPPAGQERPSVAPPPGQEKPSVESPAGPEKPSVEPPVPDPVVAGMPNPLRGPASPEASGPASKVEKKAWGKGKHGAEKFDPIKENGPIFVDWPRPKLAILITGCQHGYLEPCGCAGLDRMKGGISRRYSLFRELREKRGWTVVGLDVGGLSKGAGLQAELKFHTSVDAMRKMGYDAVALGTADLRLPTTDLVSVASPVNDKPGLFVSSNVGLFGFDAGFTGQPRIIEAAGMKIGVLAVLGKEYQRQIQNKDLEMTDPETAIAKQAPELRKKCDLLVLLAHATMDESAALGKKFPDFDVVVTAGGAAEPPAQPTLVNGKKTRLIEVGEKGMNAIVLAWFDDTEQPVRYQRVILDSRFPNSDEMKQLMVVYQEQLKDLGLQGLGIREVSHPTKDINGRFVGSGKCLSCHEPSYKIWKKSGHARAWETLVKLDPPRSFDPECISCHVVGWNPQKYFPYESGFKSEKETPQLIDVGCENCHGPGEKHVAAEMGNDKALQQKLREAVRQTLAQAEKSGCLECHDLDNSPDFDFKTYWPQVQHKEKD
jgi:hypothetical protein